MTKDWFGGSHNCSLWWEGLQQKVGILVFIWSSFVLVISTLGVLVFIGLLGSPDDLCWQQYLFLKKRHVSINVRASYAVFVSDEGSKPGCHGSKPAYSQGPVEPRQVTSSHLPLQPSIIIGWVIFENKNNRFQWTLISAGYQEFLITGCQTLWPRRLWWWIHNSKWHW